MVVQKCLSSALMLTTPQIRCQINELSRGINNVRHFLMSTNKVPHLTEIYTVLHNFSFTILWNNRLRTYCMKKVNLNEWHRPEPSKFWFADHYSYSHCIMPGTCGQRVQVEKHENQCFTGFSKHEASKTLGSGECCRQLRESLSLGSWIKITATQKHGDRIISFPLCYWVTMVVQLWILKKDWFIQRNFRY